MDDSIFVSISSIARALACILSTEYLVFIVILFSSCYCHIGCYSIKPQLYSSAVAIFLKFLGANRQYIFPNDLSIA